MRKDSSATMTTTIGLDLGGRTSHACVLDESGGVLERLQVPTTREGMHEHFATRAPCRVVLEASGPSPWVSRALKQMGHQVHVANTRRLALISQGLAKNDRQDAETLARLGRSDLGLLGRAVRHRSEVEQEHLELIKARDVLVRCRTMLINHMRGVLKSLGHRPPPSTAESFDRKVRDVVPPGLRDTLEPLLEQTGRMTAQIRSYDKAVEALAAETYPVTKLLRQVNGVGPVTSLAFVLVVGDRDRFPHARAVGAYLGLTPAQRQSGDQDPQLRITKAGNPYLRRLLVNCAHYVLGPFGKDSALRRYGFALMQRGGKNAKRRAVVAVARKLAVLMLQLWKTGEVYEPLRRARATS